jgi:hypothetical protein
MVKPNETRFGCRRIFSNVNGRRASAPLHNFSCCWVGPRGVGCAPDAVLALDGGGLDAIRRRVFADRLLLALEAVAP